MSTNNNARVERFIKSQVNKIVKKRRSQIAGAINKEITSTRKEIVESMMTKTGLKRKALNDRLAITRANPNDDVLEAKITPLFGKRIYMNEYPFVRTIARGAKAVIRLTSPLYRKNMRTGFLSKDGSRMYLRTDNDSVRAVKGRSVPRLFDEFSIQQIYQSVIKDRVLKAIRSLLT